MLRVFVKNKWLLNAQGTVAIMVAILIPVFCAVSGLMIDVGRIYYGQMAVERLAKSVALSMADPRMIITNRGAYFNSFVNANKNLGQVLSTKSYSYNVGDSQVTVTMSSTVKLWLLPVFLPGKVSNPYVVSFSSVAKIPKKTIEIALVMSEDMPYNVTTCNNYKTQIINWLNNTASGRYLGINDIRVSLVPFRQAVSLNVTDIGTMGSISNPIDPVALRSGSVSFPNGVVWPYYCFNYCGGNGQTFTELTINGTPTGWYVPFYSENLNTILNCNVDNTCFMYTANTYNTVATRYNRPWDDNLFIYARAVDEELTDTPPTDETTQFRGVYLPRVFDMERKMFVERNNILSTMGLVLKTNVSSITGVLNNWKNILDKNNKDMHKHLTNLPMLGLAWGYRTLSPQWAGYWANAPYAHNFTNASGYPNQKIILLVTSSANRFSKQSMGWGSNLDYKCNLYGPFSLYMGLRGDENLFTNTNTFNAFLSGMSTYWKKTWKALLTVYEYHLSLLSCSARCNFTTPVCSGTDMPLSVKSDTLPSSPYACANNNPIYCSPNNFSTQGRMDVGEYHSIWNYGVANPTIRYWADYYTVLSYFYRIFTNYNALASTFYSSIDQTSNYSSNYVRANTDIATNDLESYLCTNGYNVTSMLAHAIPGTCVCKARKNNTFAKLSFANQFGERVYALAKMINANVSSSLTNSMLKQMRWLHTYALAWLTERAELEKQALEYERLCATLVLNAYGYLADVVWIGHSTYTDKAALETAVDNKMLELITNINNDGITLYTIVYNFYNLPNLNYERELFVKNSQGANLVQTGSETDIPQMLTQVFDHLVDDLPPPTFVIT